MNGSSSYKHLAVMLAALLTTAIIVIIALIVLLSAPVDSPSDEVTHSKPIKDRGTSSNTNVLPPDITDLTTEPAPPSPTTSGNGQNTELPPVTEPPQTSTPPVTDDPAVTPIGPISGSAYGDKLGYLGLYGEWSTVSYDEATGNSTIRLSFYCDSYSIELGPRFNNYLIINDDRFEFRTEQITIPTNDYQVRTLLYSAEYEVQKDAPNEQLDIHIEFGWHYQGRYSGEYADWLVLIADFKV